MKNIFDNVYFLYYFCKKKTQMNSYKVKSFNLVNKAKYASYFECVLDNEMIFDIDLYSFYEYTITNDVDLAVYAGKFHDWETLSNDLLSLGFNFIEKLNNYIQIFSNSEISEFFYEKI